MMLMSGEKNAIKTTIQLGNLYGYGNLINRLKYAWAVHLMEYSDLPHVSAMLAAGIDLKGFDPDPEEWSREQAIEVLKERRGLTQS